MKTIKHIKNLVENIALTIDNKEKEELIKAVRDNYLPLFQFNIDVSFSEGAQSLFDKINENVSKSVFAPYLPDGRHTYDKVGDMIFETPTIMEWQNGNKGQNFVINYNSSTANKAQGRLNQLVVDMLLLLPANSVRLHFVDLAFSAQASFLTRNLHENVYGKLISNPNDWQQLKDVLREKCQGRWKNMEISLNIMKVRIGLRCLMIS